MKLKAWIVLVALVAVIGVLAGCGSDSDSDTAGETQTVTEEKTVTEDTPAEEPSESESDSPSEESASGGSGGGEIEVPDVEGKDHQLAQDTMQAAGLYNLTEEDATGQGRALILDRNWTVVEQDPPAGTMVSEDQTITLRSKKDDE
jgi:hypothetical protein